VLGYKALRRPLWAGLLWDYILLLLWNLDGAPDIYCFIAILLLLITPLASAHRENAVNTRMARTQKHKKTLKNTRQSNMQNTILNHTVRILLKCNQNVFFIVRVLSCYFAQVCLTLP